MRLPPFRLERFFAEHEFTAAHLLCASDCETTSIGELLALEPDAAERFRAFRLGYTETAGSPELRSAVAGLYAGTGPEQVLVHAGAEEAIFCFMHAALSPGDHVVVHGPGYQSLEEVARGVGCAVTRWRAREENGWALDPDELRRAIRPETRAVVVNVPHNPTGWHPGPAAFREVVEAVAELGLLLFSDEVYRFSEHDPEDRLPAACDLYPGAVSLGVLSKSFGLAGLRIGWVATQDERLLRAMEAFKDYTTICAAGPSEFLGELAIRHRETLLTRNRAILAGNRARLADFLARHAARFEGTPPRAGAVAFPRYLGPEGSERFCAGLLERQGVLLAPSRLFDAGDAHVRIGFGRLGFAAGLARLEAHLEAQPA